MNTRRQLPPTTSASRTSTSGSLRASRASICACSDVMDLLPLRKKSGRAPTFGTAAGADAPARKLLIEHSIGRGEDHVERALADRGLLRLQVARSAERHDRRLVVAVVEQIAAAPVELVDAVHARKLNGRPPAAAALISTPAGDGYARARRRSTASRTSSATAA